MDGDRPSEFDVAFVLNTEPVGKRTVKMLTLIAIVVAWIVLQTWVLPSFGVST